MNPVDLHPVPAADAGARRGQSLAPLLAWIMGTTDAIVLVAGGTYFGAFMAGNTTLLARAAASSDRTIATMAIALVVLFVIGVTVATLIAGGARRGGPIGLLLAQALLLAGAAVLPRALNEGAALGAAVLAMAFAHALIGLDEERVATGGVAPPGLSVPGLSITGALVRLGRGLAEAIAGGARGAWLAPLLVWGIVVVGGIAGAMLAMGIGYGAFWMPAAASLFAALSQIPHRRYAGPARGPGGRRRG